MANNAKVMDSIKSFLLKMKACDADIPEELAEDACSMVEEVKDALSEEEVKGKDEAPVEETKDGCGKDEAVTKEELNKAVEDSMVAVLKKLGFVKDSAMASLDELENKLGEEKSEDEMNEENVTVDPEKMNDSAKRDLIKAVKPVIASVSDAKQRKILSDSFAKALNMVTSTTDKYSEILDIAKSNSKDSMPQAKSSDYDFGMEIAKKYNPHYKEEN